jgi:leader peptidase (prepilin peptidase)/N-methyltransferase
MTSESALLEDVAASAVYWLAAVAGLLLGSFLNVCIYRLPRHQSIVWPGSHCPHCQAPIRPRDNIPLLSFLLLQGRCRACGVGILLRYPLVEAGLAALFVGCVARFSIGLPLLDASGFCFLLLGLLVMDLETFRLPDAFTLTGAALGLAQTLLPGHGLAQNLGLLANAPFAVPLSRIPVWISHAIAGVAAAGALLLIRWVYWLIRRREGLGLGDVKLAGLLGCWLGGAGVTLTLFLGILLGGLFGCFLLSWARVSAVSASQSRRLPLGVFLCTAGFVTLFVGPRILTWYFRFWP